MRQRTAFSLGGFWRGFKRAGTPLRLPRVWERCAVEFWRASVGGGSGSMSNRAGRPCLVARAALVALIASTALTGVAMHRAIADTLEGSLALAYQNNPKINTQHA